MTYLALYRPFFYQINLCSYILGFIQTFFIDQMNLCSNIFGVIQTFLYLSDKLMLKHIWRYIVLFHLSDRFMIILFCRYTCFNIVGQKRGLGVIVMCYPLNPLRNKEALQRTLKLLCGEKFIYRSAVRKRKCHGTN